MGSDKGMVKAAGPGLMRVEEARALLAQCRRVDEVKEIRDRALAVEAYARQKSAGQAAADDAGAIVVYATARLAEFYREAEAKPVVDNLKRVKSQPAAAPLGGKKAVAEAAGMDDRELRRWQGLAAAPPEVIEDAIARAKKVGQGVTPTTVLRAMTAVSAGDDYDGDEWYTPPEVIARVRAALGGGIDLDPASNKHAQETVRARRFFTKEDDGLAQPWSGRVFVNPPYSMPLIERFTEKLIAEWDSENVEAAVYLVNNCTDAKWQQALLHRFPVCFTSGRIGFLSRGGQKFATRQGQAIFYLGRKTDLFRDSFKDMGAVLEPTR